VSVINQRVVEYIKYYSGQGYSADRIKQFLLSNGIPQGDIDEAIRYVSRNNISQNNPTNSNPSLETQLKDYIQTQLNNGYNTELIRNALINQGINPIIVSKVISDLNNVNINVKHEVNFSTKTIAGIVACIFVIALVLFGIFNTSVLNIFQPKDSLMDIALSSTEYSYLAGDTINYQLHITNMGSMQRFDATIKYLIIDDANNVITRKEETIAVETTASVNRDIQLPLNMAPGKYYLQTIADYGGKQAKSSIEFEVVEKASDKNTNMPAQTGNNQQARTSAPVTSTGAGTSDNSQGQGNSNINNNNNNNKNNNNNPQSTSYENTSNNLGDVLMNIRELAKNNPASAANQCQGPNSEQQDICYSVVADSSQNVNYCDKISKSSYKDNCYLSFVMKGNADVCSKIQDNSSKEFCNQLKIVQLMNKYYKENNTEKIIELGKQFNPTVYNSNPQLPPYYNYTEQSVSIIDIISSNVSSNLSSIPPENNLSNTISNRTANST